MGPHFIGLKCRGTSQQGPQQMETNDPPGEGLPR